MNLCWVYWHILMNWYIRIKIYRPTYVTLLVVELSKYFLYTLTLLISFLSAWYWNHSSQIFSTSGLNNVLIITKYRLSITLLVHVLHIRYNKYYWPPPQCLYACMLLPSTFYRIMTMSELLSPHCMLEITWSTWISTISINKNIFSFICLVTFQVCRSFYSRFFVIL